MERQLARVRARIKADPGCSAAIEALLAQPTTDDWTGLLRRGDHLHRALALARGAQLAPLLQPGEELLWFGRPSTWRFCLAGAHGGYFIMMPGMLWLAIAAAVLAEMDLWFIARHPLFVLGFLLVGVFFFGVVPAVNIIRSRRLLYGVSNRRVLILEKGRRPRLHSIDLAHCGELAPARGLLGHGDLRFQPETVWESVRMEVGAPSLSPPPSGFYCIPHRQEVQRIVESARARRLQEIGQEAGTTED